MPKIKLLVPLWNSKKGDEIEVIKDKAEFAIRKGYAVKSLVLKKKTKVDPTELKDK